MTVPTQKSEVSNSPNTSNFAAATAAAGTLPTNSTAIVFGDSLVAQMEGISNNFRAYQSIAFPTYTLLKSNNIVKIPYGGNKGVSGQNTTQMVARLGAALAMNPSVVLIEAGTNDLSGGVSIDIITGNYTLIRDAFRSRDVKIVWITIPPRFGANALSAQNEANRILANTWIKSQSAADLIPVDVEEIVNSGMLSDGLHFNTAGAKTVGFYVYDNGLSNFVSTGRVSDGLFVDNSLSPNPLLVGTGGSISGGATGQVANSYALSTTNSGGAAAVASKSATNNLSQQVINISGSYTGTGKKVEFTGADFPTSTLVAGDIVEAFADIEILTTDNNFLGINTGLIVWTSGYTTLANSQSILQLDQFSPGFASGDRFVWRTPPIVIGAGIPAITKSYMAILLKDQSASTPVSISIRVHKIGIRKYIS